MSSKYNKYGSFIKKSYTNSINTTLNKFNKKEEKNNPSSKRLTGLFIGFRSNNMTTESKNNQEEKEVDNKARHRADLDEPPPETIGKYYNDRKKIIFGDLMENEILIKELIKNTQKNMIEQCKMKSNTFFGERALDVYNKMLNFKETISNYCLIIHLYLKKNQYKKAFDLFLLMCTKNKVFVEYFYRKIQEQLPKITSANKIAKFYPNITKFFIQLLACFIKLSGKFCKSRLENYFVLLYLKTIHVLSETVIERFGGVNNVERLDSDKKHIGRYFYRNCIFDTSIFFFIKYQPLSICNFILQHILDLYQEKSFNELIDVEQVLLLKVNYNLGIFLYADGYNVEAINNLNQAKIRLSDIKFLPLTKEKKDKPYNIIQNDFRNEQLPILSKLTYNKRFGSFLSGELFKRSSKHLYFNKMANKNNMNNEDCKILHSSTKNANDSFLNYNKNRTSGSSFKDLAIKKYSNSPNKSKALLSIESESKESLPRKSSGVLFGNQIMTLQQQCENVEEKIYNEIELILGEIEISQKNYKEAFIHLKNLLPLSPNIKANIYKNKNRNKYLEDQYKERKESDINYCNYYLLNENDKRRIMALLEKIERVYDNNDSYDENEINKKLTSYYLAKNYQKKNLKLINSKEMEKFFIFICSLSVYQLKILNESQPISSNIRNDLPIIFNNQFKDCLTNSQRMSLADLESMSLTRYIILKDSNGDICPENLDFRFMKYRIKDTDSDNENENNWNENEKENENNKILNKKSKRWKIIETNNTQDVSNNNYNYKFNNTLSSRKKTKNDLEDENIIIINDYDNLLNSIKNEENKEFIESYKGSIIKVLNELNKEEQKIFLNDNNILKKLIQKMKKGVNLKEKNN